jgi:enamine deaminase RidA (YjgF/YER057c/UK114 family)
VGIITSIVSVYYYLRVVYYLYMKEAPEGEMVPAGSVFATNAVNVTNFSTQFNFQLLGGTNPTADGMTFTIQGVSNAALGGTGGALGYAGIAKSVAIKFDLYSNAGEGPNSTGLYTLGAQPNATNSINLTGTGIDLHSGHVFNAAMTYDGTTLQVTITDTTTQAKATQNYTVNIPNLVGANSAYVGFTGGTGGQTATQDEQGKDISGNFEAQVRTIFSLLDKTLQNCGGSLANMVTMTVFINDVRLGDRFVEMRAGFFPGGNFPASALITVSNFARPGMLIEIDCIAYKPEKKAAKRTPPAEKRLRRRGR